MQTSMDGKIMGDYMGTQAGRKSGDAFYELAFGEHPYYRHQGWLSGRTTTDDNFTFYEKPDLDENAPVVAEGDFIADKDFGMFYVSIDPKGRLGWKSPKLHYGDITAHVIEVLTEQASNAYKYFLRNLGISYIIAGKDELDCELLLNKLKTIFGIETLMLGGGGVLNWSFIDKGLCDEVSFVVSSSADGSPDTPSVFCAKEGLSSDTGRDFQLLEAKVISPEVLWLRYEPIYIRK